MAPEAQDILQNLAKLLGQGQQQSPRSSGPDIIPGGSKAPIVGGSLPSLPPGSMASQLPQYSPGATPQGPRQLSQPMPSMASQGYSYDNPKAKTAGIITDSLHSLTAYMDQTRQHKYEKQVEEAQGVVSTVLRTSLAVDKANAAGDKDTAKLIQDQANKMLGSKEAAKILKDLNKPGSAAYYGAQKAYQGVMAEQQQKATLEETRAKISAEYERAQAERARAEAERQKALSESPEAKQKLEKIKGEYKLKAIDELSKGLDTRQANLMQERWKEQQSRAETAVKVANIHASAIKASRQDKQSMMVADSLTKAYNSISKQQNDTMIEMAKVQKDISDHPIADWWNTGEAAGKRAQMAALQSKIDGYGKQLNVLNMKRDAALAHGLITEDTSKIDITSPAEVPPEMDKNDPDAAIRDAINKVLNEE